MVSGNLYASCDPNSPDGLFRGFELESGRCCVVASGKVRTTVNQRFALKDAADAHKALEARATSGSTVLTI